MERDRPVMPDGYGVPESSGTLLAWADVEARLEAAKVYWLATTRPDGRPHVVPRWGVWLRGRFHYDGARTTRHAVNLSSNPAVTLHLEDGTQAVIVEGTSRPATPPDPELARQLSDGFRAKYGGLGYAPEPDAWSDDDAGGLSILTPVKAMAWFDFPADVTRFRFG